MNKKIKIVTKEIEILPTDDFRTIIKKMDKIRIKIKGFNSVKYIQSNR